MSSTDFQQILTSPVLTYQEGLRFFIGEGILNETLRRVVKDLADVQELVKIRNLKADFAEKLNPFVREKFLELQKAVEESGE
jgi:hypothetical protein